MMLRIGCFIIALLWLLIDQYTKVLSVEILKNQGTTIDVLPVLSWRYAENHGAAFGFLSTQSGWQKYFFVIVGVIAVLLILILMIKTSKKQWVVLLGYACILGGAIGNIYDRVTFGYVRDMISVYYEPWQFYFAIFNVADMAISIGVFLLIVDWLVSLLKKKA